MELKNEVNDGAALHKDSVYENSHGEQFVAMNQVEAANNDLYATVDLPEHEDRDTDSETDAAGVLDDNAGIYGNANGERLEIVKLIKN